MCVQLILLLLLRLGRSKYRSMINLIPSCQCCLHYTHIIFLFYRVRSNSWKPIEIFVSPTFLFFFSSKILKRHFTNIVQIIINHIPLWNSWREDYSDLNGFWIIKLNLVCFESYSSVDTTVNGSVSRRFFLKIPTFEPKNHENLEPKNTPKITKITSKRPQNRGKITDFFWKSFGLKVWVKIFEEE